MSKRCLLLAALLFCTGGALAQAPCRVADPELAGAYEGGCEGGLAEGFGVAKGTAEYRGQFHQGMKHGQDVKLWPNGDRYEGSFSNDRKDGKGIYVWNGLDPARRESYSGEFRNDLRHGTGAYTWATGETYSGPWANDSMTGPLPPALLTKALADKAAESSAVREAKVCRKLQIGISESDLLVGRVVETKAGQIGVRIEAAGRFPNVLNGVAVREGAIIWDDATAWTPCA